MKARFFLAACVCGAFVGTPAVGDFSGTRRENLCSDGEPHARANERTWAIPMFVRSLVRCDVSKRAGVLLFGLRPFCSRDRKATSLPQKKGPVRSGPRRPPCPCSLSSGLCSSPPCPGPLHPCSPCPTPPRPDLLRPCPPSLGGGRSRRPCRIRAAPSHEKGRDPPVPPSLFAGVPTPRRYRCRLSAACPARRPEPVRRRRTSWCRSPNPT